MVACNTIQDGGLVDMGENSSFRVFKSSTRSISHFRWKIKTNEMMFFITNLSSHTPQKNLIFFLKKKIVILLQLVEGKIQS